MSYLVICYVFQTPGSKISDQMEGKTKFRENVNNAAYLSQTVKSQNSSTYLQF